MAGDNTGKVFQGTVSYHKRDVARMLQRFFRKPALFKCGQCNGDEFWIYTDTDERSGVCMIQCKNPNCQRGTPPFEIRVVQANDDILARHGIFLPDPHLSSQPRGAVTDEEVRRFLDAGDDDDD